MKKSRYILSLILLITSVLNVHSQDFNECGVAYKIVDPRDWCSESQFFDNSSNTNSGYGDASCWSNGTNDVWLEFVSVANAVNIIVDGVQGNTPIVNLNIALYNGTCSGNITELNCASGAGALSMFETGLIPSIKYWIRISGINGSTGKFSVCIKNYNPPTEPGQDCTSASVLCDKSNFVVQSVSSSGNDPDEAAGTCLKPSGSTLSENQSTWFKWTAANNGTLTFTLTPLKADDDLDFALYELESINNCSTKRPIRCMATACEGPTGLNLSSTDLEEDFDCNPGEDGFVKYIDMEEGKSYALLVNNFTSSNFGFSMEFGGTGEFLGPQADFAITPESGLACDQEFQIKNLSTTPPNIFITDYNWVFGDRAIPASSTDKDPVGISYESYGDKLITLQLTTDKGCIVTKSLPLTAEPCCEDLPDIDIQLENSKDASCPNTKDGSLAVSGSGGSPEYIYQIGELTNTSGSFGNLAPGTYSAKIIDIKGCVDSIPISIGSPNPVIADAGSDIESDLGDDIQLMGSYSPPGTVNSTLWTSNPIDTLLSCTDCPDPTTIPPGTTTYYYTVDYAEGCTSTDSITVRVQKIRKVYAPNVINPNSPNFDNRRFNLFGNRAIRSIASLKVYDRWGLLVYEGKDLDPNDRNLGWDGNANGTEVSGATYTWIAKVAFIDNVTLPYHGDVSVVR